MNFAHTWKNMKIKRKVLLLFLSLNIVSILLVLLPFTIVLSITVKEDINENAAKQLQLITAQTEEIVSNVNYNIKAFSTSSTLQNAILESYSDDDYGTYLFSSALHNCVHNIMDIDSLISNGYIQTYDGKVYDVKSGKVTQPDANQNKAYESIRSHGGRIISSPPTDNSGKSALNLSKSLIDINTGRILGVLSFDIIRLLAESVLILCYIVIISNGNI